jgi:iron complex transport system ATP-binding protein
LPRSDRPAAAESGATLRTEGLTLGYDGRPVVHDLDLDFPSGRVTAIVGPNGCGKSTLLRALARVHRPTAGRVLLGEADLAALRGREVARVVGFLPQQPVAPPGITVAELVGRGRTPHQGWFGRHTGDDEVAVAEALQAAGLADLAGVEVDELSGGQRQRVWVAMVLAQRAQVLLLDEPTTFLDVAYQIDLLDLFAELNRDRGTTVIMVLHDLNLAARYAHHLIAMRDGRVVVQGEPSSVLDSAAVAKVFGLSARVVDDPVSGTPLVVPLGRYIS